MVRMLFAASAVLALAACGSGNRDENRVEGVGNGAVSTAMEDTTAMAVGAAGAPLVNNAESFVSAAAISDMYEVQAGEIAAKKARAPEIKAFAEMMVKDHTATSAKLKEVLAQNNIALTPPAALDARRKGMIDNLDAASAEDFDEVYLDQQVAAHQEALSFMRSYADDGENAALKKLAADTAPKIQQHLDEARRLDENDVDDPQQ